MQEMNRAEVTVLGAGIFGLSVAWACVKRGAQVRVIDPMGVGAGASGGLVGALAPHTPELWDEKKQFQFESLIMAENYWAEIEAFGGKSAGYSRSGRLQPIADARTLELAQTRVISAQSLWQGKAIWQVVDPTDDWVPPSPTGKIIRDTLSARIHPRQACAALAAALLAKGVAVEQTGAPSGRIVHATGYQGLLDMAEHLDQPIGNGVKGQALLLDFDARDKPQLFADGLHIIPHSDGTLAVGSTSERYWEGRASTDALLEDVYTRAIAAFPVLQGAPVIERWAGVRPRAKSRAPLLGPHPYRAGEFVSNGGFKIGFGMAPMVGEVMADLVLNGTDRIPDSFRVEASLL
jgi:glycine/D-amino acid oxidase-like deaminating enzyme